MTVLRISSKLIPFVFALGLFTSLSLTGCGGGGAVQIGTHYYPGTWAGTVTTKATASIPARSGTMVLNITSGDQITGTDTISVPGTTTNDTGSIAYSGAFTLSSSKTGSNGVVATFTGTLIVVSDTLKGSGTMVIDRTSVPADFVLKTAIASQTQS